MRRYLTLWSCWDGGLRTEILEIGRKIEKYLSIENLISQEYNHNITKEEQI